MLNNTSGWQIKKMAHKMHLPRQKDLNWDYMEIFTLEYECALIYY